MNQYEMKQRAYQSNLKSRALQVLLYLIDRSNKEQTCFPAVPTIGRELHISISTVKRAMKELIEAGYVTKESRFRAGNGGQTSNLYTLYFPDQIDEHSRDFAKSNEKRVETELEVKEKKEIIIEKNVECLNQNEIDYSKEEQNAQAKKVSDYFKNMKRMLMIKCLKTIVRCNTLIKHICYSTWTGEEVSLIPP